MSRRPPMFSAALCLALAVTVSSVSFATDPSSTSQAPPSGANPKAPRSEAALERRARRLHREAIVIDTHNDITSPMVDEGFDLGSAGDDPKARTKTHTDLRRMKAGGLDAEFFAVYVGREFVNKKPAEGGGAARRALDVIDSVHSQVQRHPEALEMAYTSGDIRRIARSGKIAALMGIEGGHAIEDSLRTLRMFYRLGVRYMTLTHTNTNDWADSSGDIDDQSVKHHNGLDRKSTRLNSSHRL